MADSPATEEAKPAGNDASVAEGSWVKQKDIFVGNLSLFTTHDSLRAHFSKFGDITDVRIMVHPETKRSRRFGFVTFSSEASVRKVLNYGEKHCLDGKILDVKNAFKKSDEEGGLPPVKTTKKPFLPKELITDPSMIKAVPAPVKVFVGGISQETTRDHLKAHFSKFGQIDKLNLLLDKATNKHRGFAFVEYATEHFADLACANRFHNVNGKEVEVKIAQQQSKTANQTAVQSNSSGLQLPMVPLMFWPPNFGLENQTLAISRFDLNPARFSPYPNATLQQYGAPFQDGHQHGLYPLQALLQAAQQCQSFFPALLPTQSEYRPPVLYPMLKEESQKR